MSGNMRALSDRVATKCGICLPDPLRKRLAPGLRRRVNDALLWRDIARVEPRPSSRPVDTTVNLCSACNMSCPICNIGALREHGMSANNQVAFEQFFGLYDFFRCAGKVDFNGFIGESLLNRDFMRIARVFKSQGTVLYTSTNGLALTESVQDALLDLGFDHINFSLHAATAETYGRLQSGHFDRVVANARRLLSERRRRGLRNPTVTIVYALNSANLGECKQMLDLAEELGVDALSVYHYRDYGFREIALDNDPGMANEAIDALYVYAESKGLVGLLPAVRPYYSFDTDPPDDIHDAGPPVRCELPWRGLQLIGSCAHDDCHYLSVCSMFRPFRFNYREHAEACGKVRYNEIWHHPLFQFLRQTVNPVGKRPRNPLCHYCKSRWRDFMKNVDNRRNAAVKAERLGEFHAALRAAFREMPSIPGLTLLTEEDAEFTIY